MPIDPYRLLSWLPVEKLRHPPPVVPVVPLSGLIGAMGPLRAGMTLRALAPILERAFSLPRSKAVALAINSPGGSPVQSALIAGRIRALAEEKKLPVIAFVEDVAASGGYWLASAADEIFADRSSIVGSIGVISAGFGFQGLIERIGVERRLYTAGEKKSLLDPFRPADPEEEKRLRAVQQDIHEAFKEQVRRRRGERLKGGEETLFSGEFWTGRKALELGLVDGLGELRGELRRRYGETLRLPVVAPPRGWLRRRLRFGSDGGPGDWAAGLLAAAEERAAWARFGL